MKTLAAILALLLAGCATGVKMSEAEAARCRENGCTAWTAAEIRALSILMFREGFTRGERAGKEI